MTREFAGIFSRPPDEIVCGDYIYHSPAFERQTAEIIKSTGALYEKYRSRRDESRKRTRERFAFLWKERSFDCKKTSLFYEPWLEGIYGENGDPRISALIEKLAAEGGPFMDIASSESMGLAPYFLSAQGTVLCVRYGTLSRTMQHRGPAQGAQHRGPVLCVHQRYLTKCCKYVFYI